jgi:hypothetical protein
MNEVTRLFDSKSKSSRIIEINEGIWVYADDKSAVPENHLKGFFTNGLCQTNSISVESIINQCKLVNTYPKNYSSDLIVFYNLGLFFIIG